jgi:NADP-dependent 3-hydroxy acid dehydrogenase YdfG
VHRVPSAVPPEARRLGRLAGVVSLAGLDDRPHQRFPALTNGLAATVDVLKAYDAPVWIVTDGAVGTSADDPVRHPARAQAWGLGVVHGLSGAWSGLIDLPASVDDAAVERLVDVLAGSSGEDQLAVRDGAVLARRLVPAPCGSGPAWRPRGTVLVTGGTGALGGHVARWAARNGAAHLLLTSRRGLAAPGAPELYDELVELGARVTMAACDVGDRDALAALLADLPDDAPLTAVVHAAGVTQPEIPVAEMSLDDLGDVIRGKVDGARHLDTLTEGLPLDAFVLFSSGAGIWGDVGKAGYAAANAHLDALANERRARGRPATSIAWGAWQDGGMVVGDVADLLVQRGMRQMRPESAVDALAVAVGRGDTNVVVASIDLARFLPLYTMARPRKLVSALASAPPASDPVDRVPETGLPARLAGLPAAEQEGVLLDLVRREVAMVLGNGQPDEIRPRRPFKELGFDSLTALEFRNRMNTAIGLRLPATLVFDQPTPARLAAYLRTELGPPSPLVELDRLEASLAALDGPGRDEVLERLRALLRRADAGDALDGVAEDDLAAASDDEIFDLIDRELGIS